MRTILASIFVSLLALSLTASSAYAVIFVKGASLSSTTFRVLDPQHTGFSTSASSDNFRLLSAIGDTAIGSSSATSFGLRSGSLYYPLVIAPALTSATPGSGDVDLQWTAAAMDVGWIVSGYNVCTKPAAGSYTCEDVESVTSFIKDGLSNGTTYTFKIQAKEMFGEVIAESGELSAEPAGGGGGGGGGGSFIGDIGNQVSIDGWAYPDAVVTILRDGFAVGTETADSDGSFDFRQMGITSGTYTYGFWAQDTQGRRSVIRSLPLTFIGNRVYSVSNVIIAPTIAFTMADSVSPGGSIGIEGAAMPNSRVRIRVNPGNIERTVFAAGDDDGTYEYSFDTTGLSAGEYDISTRAELPPSYVNMSQYSQLFPFGVGVLAPEVPEARGNPADINHDTRVDLADFSILAFWWKRTPLPAIRPFDLNRDGQVQLDDFSILAFYWSG